MIACRAALLLITTLTCSAWASEPQLVSFSADHVTIKVEVGFVFLDNPNLKEPALRKEQRMAKVLAVAKKFCGAYGKNPHEIIRELEYIRNDYNDRSPLQYDTIHYACNDPEWWGLFEDKEQPRP